MVAVSAGVTLALLTFSVDVTIAGERDIQVSSQCDQPILEAFRRDVDGASLVDEPGATPELSDGFGCRQPARQRLIVGGGGVAAGLVLFVLSLRRRTRPAPIAPPAPNEEAAGTGTTGDDIDTIRQHYEGIREEDRLTTGHHELELVRTRQILRRHLPPAPASIIDIGGGTGVHAAWLAEAGYQVHVVDLTPRHVELVTRLLGERGATAAVGDARQLDAGNASYDAALLLGPLYHLVDRDDRLQALREARRVVKPGGVVAVAAINRFASLFDGLARGFLFDAEFREIVGGDLRDGHHRNVQNRPHWFTTAFFHHPGELAKELVDAGLDLEELVGVEGMAEWMPHLETQWSTREGRQVIVEAAQGIEAEPTLLGLSAHLLAVGRRPGERRARRLQKEQRKQKSSRRR